MELRGPLTDCFDAHSETCLLRCLLRIAMKGRIEFVFIAALACQSFHVTSLMAADQTGVASVYSTESGSETASGEKLNPEALSAAHRTLSFGTKAKVRNKRNGQSVDVIIKDRGPFVRGRIIDLSPAAARVLGFSGLADVTVSTDE
jgi:peptidoglycan lytic transglycosylase